MEIVSALLETGSVLLGIIGIMVVPAAISMLFNYHINRYLDAL